LYSITDWLSGSGGTGETRIIFTPFPANRASCERQSRCPIGAGVGRACSNLLDTFAYLLEVSDELHLLLF